MFMVDRSSNQASLQFDIEKTLNEREKAIRKQQESKMASGTKSGSSAALSGKF